jgi:multiple sugar transport system substrate-binding protein
MKRSTKGAAVARIALLALAVLALALAGCAKGGGSKKATELNLLMEDVPETHIIAKLLPEFEKATGIKVNFEIVQYGDMHSKLITQFMSAQSKYDVIEVDNYWAGEFPAANWLCPLTDYLKKDKFDTSVYVPQMLDMVGYYPVNDPKRTLYMLPMYNYTMALIYRTDLLNDAGLQKKYKDKFNAELKVPETLEDYVRICAFMQANAKVAGSAMQAGRGDPVVMEWTNYLFGLGGEYYDAKWAPKINDERALKAVQLYRDNLIHGAPKGAASYNLDDSLRVMSSGEAFSMITYNWMLAQLESPEKSKVVGKVAIAPMPGAQSLAGGWGWGIAKNTPYKDDAWRFIKWVESFDVAKRRALDGGAPTRSDVLRDAEVLAKYPYYALVEQILTKSKPVPEFQFSAQMVESVGRELSLIMAENKDPKVALDLAASDLAELAKKAGLSK